MTLATSPNPKICSVFLAWLIAHIIICKNIQKMMLIAMLVASCLKEFGTDSKVIKPNTTMFGSFP